MVTLNLTTKFWKTRGGEKKGPLSAETDDDCQIVYTDGEWFWYEDGSLPGLNPGGHEEIISEWPAEPAAPEPKAGETFVREFIIFGPDGQKWTCYRAHTADYEASNFAIANPGKTFTVFEAVRAFRVDLPEPIVLSPVDPEDAA